jgi:hypothetical protein
MAYETSLVVDEGNALVYYAFDVGAGIDINKAETFLAEAKRLPAGDKKRQNKYFEFTPPPIRIIEEDCPIVALGAKFSTVARVEILVFDFGSISVRFQIPIKGQVKDIIDLSVELYENVKLQEAAKNVVKALTKKIIHLIDRPTIAERIEDYLIFHFAKTQQALSPHDLLKDHMMSLTSLLRAEVDRPSDREVQEILTDRISYGSNDVTLMSWYSAVIYGEDAEDIYRVLEFANLVLMELSFLDSRLDKSLDEFYDYFSFQHKETGLFRFDWRSQKPQMRRITQLQIDSAISFERITNALKLMGDDFQARVYQMATRKMGLATWDASVTRKLQTIESIYQKISDSEGSRRMEVMELIIIILITVSILAPMIFPKLAH